MQGLRAIFQMLLSNAVLHIPSFPTSEARRAMLSRAVLLTRLPGHTGQCPVTRSRHILTFLGNNLPGDNSPAQGVSAQLHSWAIFQYIPPHTNGSCSSVAVVSASINQLYGMHQFRSSAIKYTCIIGISTMFAKKQVFSVSSPATSPSICRTEHRTGQSWLCPA